MNLKDQLIRHEGLKLKPYPCSKGKWTIGVGRNLQDVGLTNDELMQIIGHCELTRMEAIAILKRQGITEDQAMMLLNNDINRCMAECRRNFPFFDSLTEARQDVLLNMCFNVGIFKLRGFKKMIEALKIGDYEEAAAQMKDSQWHIQVGNRAVELEAQMIKG